MYGLWTVGSYTYYFIITKQNNKGRIGDDLNKNGLFFWEVLEGIIGKISTVTVAMRVGFYSNSHFSKPECNMLEILPIIPSSTPRKVIQYSYLSHHLFFLYYSVL